jgi:hypothetical protein
MRCISHVQSVGFPNTDPWCFEILDSLFSTWRDTKPRAVTTHSQTWRHKKDGDNTQRRRRSEGPADIGVLAATATNFIKWAHPDLTYVIGN